MGDALMIIREINLYHVQMLLFEPWVMAYGARDSIESTLVNFHHDFRDLISIIIFVYTYQVK